MKIMDKLLRYKYHLVFLLLTCLFLAFLAPSFLTVVAYFWPLLVSTAFFLIAVVVFGKTSATTASDDDPSSVGRAGEGILDYVAGPTEPDIEPVAAEVEVEAEGESFKDEAEGESFKDPRKASATSG